MRLELSVEDHPMPAPTSGLLVVEVERSIAVA
jgi:hypothetical protein